MTDTSEWHISANKMCVYGILVVYHTCQMNLVAKLSPADRKQNLSTTIAVQLMAAWCCIHSSGYSDKKFPILFQRGGLASHCVYRDVGEPSRVLFFVTGTVPIVINHNHTTWQHNFHTRYPCCVCKINMQWTTGWLFTYPLSSSANYRACRGNH